MTLLHTAKTKYLLILQVCRYIERAVKQEGGSDISEYALDLQVSKYGLLAVLWQEKPVKKQ